MGVDGVELDVYLSADGVPVVIHDQDVSRTTDGQGRVTALMLAELQALDAGSHFDPAYAGERVPTLEEVFAALGRSLLYDIELKPTDRRGDGIVRAVVDLVRRMELTDNILLSSFEPYKLYTARRLAPEIPCGVIYGPLNPFTPLFLPFTPHEALHPQADMLTPYAIMRAHRQRKRVVTWTVDDARAARRLARWGVDLLITNVPDRILPALDFREA
jgi:glycerophosphoryl diester phosphodiesterase